MSIIVLSLEVSKTWSFYYIPHSQSQRAAIVVQSCKNVIVDSVLCKILVEWVHKTDITRIPKISQTLKKVHFQQGHQCYFASTKINQILNSMTQQEFLFSIIEVGSSWHRQCLLGMITASQDEVGDIVELKKVQLKMFIIICYVRADFHFG